MSRPTSWPHSSYLVCATPRSGSTLLCEALAATGVAGRPAEYVEAMYDTGLPRRPTDYFEGLRALPAAGFLADQLPAEGGDAREALRQARPTATTCHGCSPPARRPTGCSGRS